VVIVKICGVTTLEDSLAALDAGADMLGFNFYPPSSRCISVETCRQIVAGLQQHPSQALLVGVFVNAPLQEIQHTLQACSLDLAQLSGDEPEELLQALGECAFKALRPSDLAGFQESLRRYPSRVQPPAWLVDAYRPGSFGGGGQTADWDLAASLAANAPILLAGGLTPLNIPAAVARVKPWGVDVASGVESSPGRKDRQKMDAFVQASRQAAKENNL
jgi:phosphoribosylanthranilate isomerase